MLTSRSLVVSLSALMLGLGIGCGDPGAADPPADPPGQKDPPAMGEMKEDRLTLTGTWMLKPGEETYRCILYRWERKGGLAIRKIAPRQSTGVHHVGVFTDDLHTERNDQWECEEMGLWGYVFGGGVGTGALQMPTGTARHIDEGTPIILQLHLLNASPTAAQVTATVDLDLAKEGETTTPVGAWLVGRTSLNLPAMQRSSAEGVCTKHPELKNLFAVFPHMHKLGDSMEITAGTDRATKVLSMPRWDFGDQGTLAIAPTQDVAANAPIQTRCSYNNTTEKTVNFGLHTGDEMCIAVLYYWPETTAPGLSVCQR